MLVILYIYIYYMSVYMLKRLKSALNRHDIPKTMEPIFPRSLLPMASLRPSSSAGLRRVPKGAAAEASRIRNVQVRQEKKI